MTTSELRSDPAVPEARAEIVPDSSTRHTLGLLMHLVWRDIAQNNRFSAIGAAWPLVRQLAQLAVLVIAFSAVLQLGIPNYAVFVFCGLIGWSWFVAGLMAATNSVGYYRALAMRPRFPTIILPVVATAVPFVDVLFAVPVLLAMLAISGELHATAPLYVPILLLQAVMAIGLGWITGALSVFFRDIPQLVGVVLLMAFYLTPVYFDVGRVPDQYEWILRLNPMAVILEAERAVLLGTPFPPLIACIGVVIFSFGSLIIGWFLFKRLAPRFADEL